MVVDALVVVCGGGQDRGALNISHFSSIARSCLRSSSASDRASGLCLRRDPTLHDPDIQVGTPNFESTHFISTT